MFAICREVVHTWAQEVVEMTDELTSYDVVVIGGGAAGLNGR